LSHLPRQELRRGQIGLIRFVLAGTANNALVQAVGPLFLLSLGAAPFHLGILATFSQLDKIARLGGVQLLGRGFGKTRLMFWGRLLSIPATVLLVLVAIITHDHGHLAIWLAVAVIALRAALQQTGNAAWWPLIQDVTAGAGLGQFLTRMRVQQRLLELALPLAIGIYLADTPSPARFAPLFGGSILVLLLGAMCIRGVAELPSAHAEGSLTARMRQTLAMPAVARFCRYQLLRALFHSACFPFWVIALTERGLPVSQFVWMSSVLAGGQIVSLWFWGRVVDRHGYRPALLPCLSGLCMLSAAWFVLPTGGLGLLLWVGAVYLLWGILEAGVQMGQSRAMVDAVPTDLQAEGFAVIIFASAIGGGAGGLLGGFLFSAASTYRVAGLDGDILYLAIVQAGFCLPLLAGLNLGAPPTGNHHEKNASQAA
jgi:hypothetical protein